MQIYSHNLLPIFVPDFISFPAWSLDFRGTGTISDHLSFLAIAGLFTGINVVYS
jgi:hypothetical protein